MTKRWKLLRHVGAGCGPVAFRLKPTPYPIPSVDTQNRPLVDASQVRVSCPRRDADSIRRTLSIQQSSVETSVSLVTAHDSRT